MSFQPMNDPQKTDSRPADWLNKIEIRLADKSDLREMEWEGEYQHFRRVYNDVYDRSRRGLALMWVAELPGEGLLGQAFIQLRMTDRSSADGKKRAYLHSFRVRPAVRGQGLGTAIMRHVEQDLLRRGFRELTLNVSEENEGAIRLYLRLGYKIVKRISGEWAYYDDQGRLQTVAEPGYRLIKQLS